MHAGAAAQGFGPRARLRRAAWRGGGLLGAGRRRARALGQTRAGAGTTFSGAWAASLFVTGFTASAGLAAGGLGVSVVALGVSLGFGVSFGLAMGAAALLSSLAGGAGLIWGARVSRRLLPPLRGSWPKLMRMVSGGGGGVCLSRVEAMPSNTRRTRWPKKDAMR